MNATIATKGKGKGVTLATSCLIGFMGLCNAAAAPIYDDGLVPYPYTWSIFNSGGTGSFVNGTEPGQPTLTVTTVASQGSSVIFEWNPTNNQPPGVTSYGASLALEDSQYILVLNGVAPVIESGGAAVPLLMMPLFGTIPGSLTGYGGGYITVTPDANGTYSFDMRELAESIYTPQTMPTLWTMQLAFIRPDGADYQVGYSFESFAAVPEPSTVAIVTMAGLALVVFFRKRIRLAA